MAHRVLILSWHPSGLLMRAAIQHHLRVLEHAGSELDVLYFNAFRGVPRWIRHATPEALILHTILPCLRWSEHFETMRRDGTNPFIPEELWSQSEASAIAPIRPYAKRGDRILDVGMGLGRLLTPFPDLRRFGMEISSGYLEIAKATGIDVCFARIEDISYREEWFDVIVYTDVLDLNLCCAKFLSGLKPGGFLIVRVPYRQDLSRYQGATCPYTYVHLRAFDEHVLRLLFERVFNCSMVRVEAAGYMAYENRCGMRFPCHDASRSSHASWRPSGNCGRRSIPSWSGPSTFPSRSTPWSGSPRVRPRNQWQPAPGRLGLFRSCPDS